jgi:hypothetical protein
MLELFSSLFGIVRTLASSKSGAMLQVRKFACITARPSDKSHSEIVGVREYLQQVDGPVGHHACNTKLLVRFREFGAH